MLSGVDNIEAFLASKPVLKRKIASFMRFLHTAVYDVNVETSNGILALFIPFRWIESQRV